MFSVDEILPSSSGELSVNIPGSGNVALSSGFSAGMSSLCTTNQVPSECWLIIGREDTLRPDAPRPSGRYGRCRRAALISRTSRMEPVLTTNETGGEQGIREQEDISL